MFPFRRTSQTLPIPRWFNAGAQLVCMALASVLLSATAADSSPGSKSIPSPFVPQATARPEVVMMSTRRDFGDVFAGEELEAAFGLRNAGTAPLELAQKSSLGIRTGKPEYPVAAAWHANDLLTRRVAATRVAPT